MVDEWNASMDETANTFVERQEPEVQANLFLKWLTQPYFVLSKSTYPIISTGIDYRLVAFCYISTKLLSYTRSLAAIYIISWALITIEFRINSITNLLCSLLPTLRGRRIWGLSNRWCVYSISQFRSGRGATRVSECTASGKAGTKSSNRRS